MMVSSPAVVYAVSWATSTLLLTLLHPSYGGGVYWYLVFALSCLFAACTTSVRLLRSPKSMAALVFVSCVAVVLLLNVPVWELGEWNTMRGLFTQCQVPQSNWWHSAFGKKVYLAGEPILHARKGWAENRMFTPAGVKQPGMVNVSLGQNRSALVVIFEVRGFDTGDGKRSCDDRAYTLLAYRIKILNEGGGWSRAKMLTEHDALYRNSKSSISLPAYTENNRLPLIYMQSHRVMKCETYSIRMDTTTNGGNDATLVLLAEAELKPDGIARQVCVSLGQESSACYDTRKMHEGSSYDGLYVASSSKAVITKDHNGKPVLVAGMHIGRDPRAMKHTAFVAMWEYNGAAPPPRVKAIAASGPQILEPSLALHKGVLYVNARSAGSFNGFQWRGFCRHETQIRMADILSGEKAPKLDWACHIRDNIIVGTDAPLLYHHAYLYTALPTDPAARYGISLYRRPVLGSRWEHVINVLPSNVFAHSPALAPISAHKLAVAYEVSGFTSRDSLLGVVSMPRAIAYTEVDL